MLRLPCCLAPDSRCCPWHASRHPTSGHSLAAGNRIHSLAVGTDSSQGSVPTGSQQGSEQNTLVLTCCEKMRTTHSTPRHIHEITCCENWGALPRARSTGNGGRRW